MDQGSFLDSGDFVKDRLTIVFPADALKSPLGNSKPDDSDKLERRKAQNTGHVVQNMVAGRNQLIVGPVDACADDAPVFVQNPVRPQQVQNPQSAAEPLPEQLPDAQVIPELQSNPEEQISQMPMRPQQQQIEENTAQQENSPTEVMPVAQASSKPDKKHNALAFLSALVLILFTIVLTFQILIVPLVSQVVGQQTISARYDIGVSQSELVSDATNTVFYIFGNKNASIPAINTDYTGYSGNTFASIETMAMYVMISRGIAALLLIILVIFLLKYASINKNRKTISPALRAQRKYGSVMIVSAVVLIVIVAGFAIWGVIDFNSLFNTAHSVFFPNTSWNFLSSALIASIFPYNYWVIMSIIWGGLILVFAVIYLIVGIVKKVKGNKTSY